MTAPRRITQLPRGGWALVLALLLAAAGPAARAQQAGSDVGHGRSALPAVDAVPVLIAGREHPIRAHVSLGYGYTEEVLDAGDAHHRSEAQLALSYQPIEALALAGRYDARLDSHTGEGGGDEGFASQAWLIARAGVPAGSLLRAGAELALRFPAGSDVGRSFTAISPEVRALLTLAPPGSRTQLSSAIGFRLDRAREGTAELDRLSVDDRIGLGASDANAVLVGLGVVHRIGAFALLGEWTWDVQVGGRAAAALESPMRLSAGGRWLATPSLHLQLIAGVSPSARPSVALDEPLYPIEPRVFAALGLGMRFGAAPVAKARIESPPPAPPPAPAAEPPAPQGRRMSGRVVDGASHTPIEGAAIVAAGGAAITTDAAGMFQLESIPLEFVELRVSAHGFKDALVPVPAGAGQSEDLEIELEPDDTTALIRGSVSNFQGRPIAGRVVVQPGDHSAVLDADASFEIEVPAGEYTVLIDAPGYDSQERVVRVERGDVAVIVVQMRSER